MTRAERLMAWCEAQAEMPAQWGVNDCTLFAARWAEAETGQHLNLPAYDSEAEARALIERAGGLAELWRAHVPFDETDAPIAGDVGIVQTRLFGEVGVIWTRPGIAAWRAVTGVKLFTPNPDYVVANWSLPA